MINMIKHHANSHKLHCNFVVIAIIFGILLFLSINYGCGANPTSTSTSPSTTAGAISGIVIDMSGNGTPDATITVGGKSTTSSSQGYFSFNDLTPSNNVPVSTSKAGYVPTQQIVTLLAGNTKYMIIYLKNEGASTSFTGAAGGTATNITTAGTADVIIPAGYLVDQSGTPVTGPVTVCVTAFDLSITPEFNSFPGIFSGRTSQSGTDSPFTPYAYIDISIVDQSGNPVNLNTSPNATAEVHIPITPAFQSDAPDTIEVWTYNATGGYWLFTTVATKDGTGTFYRAVLNHFSGLCAASSIFMGGYLNGTVVDNLGNPVAGADVFAKSLHFQSSGITDTSGKFTGLDVQINCRKEVWAQKGDKISSKEVVDPDPILKKETYNMTRPLTLESAGIVATIKMSWYIKPMSPTPFELYSHFTGSLEGSTTRFHLTTSNVTQAGANASMESIAEPQVINISKWNAGTTYRFCCENGTYASSTMEGVPGPLINMNASTAEVVLEISGLSSYIYNIPASNPLNKNVWRVFEIKIDPLGSVYSVTTLNDYAVTNEAAPEPYLYP